VQVPPAKDPSPPSPGEEPRAKSTGKPQEPAQDAARVNAGAGTDIPSPSPASGAETAPPRKSTLMEVIDRALEE
jgi:hypothetical protein